MTETICVTKCKCCDLEIPEASKNLVKGLARFVFIQKGFDFIPDTAYFNVEDENSELNGSTVSFNTVLKNGWDIVL